MAKYPDRLHEVVAREGAGIIGTLKAMDDQAERILQALEAEVRTNIRLRGLLREALVRADLPEDLMEKLRKEDL